MEKEHAKKHEFSNKPLASSPSRNCHHFEVIFCHQMDSVKSESVPAMVWSFKHVYIKEEKVEGLISATFHILSKDRDFPLSI